MYVLGLFNGIFGIFDKTFSCFHDVLEEKEKNLNKKNLSHIFNWGPTRQARYAKKQVALENSLRLHTPGGPATAAEAG